MANQASEADSASQMPIEKMNKQLQEEAKKEVTVLADLETQAPASEQRSGSEEKKKPENSV